MAEQSEFSINGKKVRVTNLAKVFYPSTGFTKGDVINYYIGISPVLLPHLKNRALTLKRYPNGVRGAFFYEKSCPDHRPPWVKTQGVWSDGRGDCIDYCVINDLATLVWMANIADLELHTFLSIAKKPTVPTMIVFDLDPGEPADIVECCQVAIWLRHALSSVRLNSYAKTSGSKGLQVYVPLNTSTTFGETKAVAWTLAQVLEHEHPDLIVSRMQKNLRKGKVLIDWSQNDEHKTTVCVYSLRAKEEPTVSTPVTWEEVEQCWKKRSAALLTFDPQATLRRVENTGDLFAAVLEEKQRLPRGTARAGSASG